MSVWTNLLNVLKWSRQLWRQNFFLSSFGELVGGVRSPEIGLALWSVVILGIRIERLGIRVSDAALATKEIRARPSTTWSVAFGLTDELKLTEKWCNFSKLKFLWCIGLRLHILGLRLQIFCRSYMCIFNLPKLFTIIGNHLNFFCSWRNCFLLIFKFNLLICCFDVYQNENIFYIM